MKIPTICLPDPSQLELEAILVEENTERVIMKLAAKQLTAKCPQCHELSHQVHSHYRREVRDLPWGGIAVTLHLQVRRFFCRNLACPRKIFTERLPSIVAPWGRRTQRLASVQQQLGLVAGGKGGAKLSRELAMTVSTDTILRQVRQQEVKMSPTPRVLGVDDWAHCKGHTYGTILIDLERSKIIDILPDRTAEAFAQWLSEHPGIEIISRDRAEAYAEGAQCSAPSATQVADRWHLLKNLSEALLKVLQHHHQLIETLLRDTPTSTVDTTSATVAQSADVKDAQQTETYQGLLTMSLTQAVQHRAQRVERAQHLYQQGWSKRAIADHLNLDPKTIRRYLNLSSPILPQRRQRRSMLDPFYSYLLERWQAGCHNAAQLFREIQAQNFLGKSSTVRHHLKELRKQTCVLRGTRPSQEMASEPMQRPPTLRTLLWFILERPDALPCGRQRWVDPLITTHSKLSATIRLAQDFAAMVRQRQVNLLPTWLEQAAQSGSIPFQNLARSLRRDYAAVAAALSLPWSNGATEGHINRLKSLKRQMYGRAKFDLLRLRLLAA